MSVNLNDYIFQKIEYDPTEEPRGIVTADEWNTILGLLKSASNYTSESLQEIIADLYTASELHSTALGSDGARLIGVDTIPGVSGTNVNAVLRSLKEQLDGVTLGLIPDGSITSAKLDSDLNFTGDTLTFNEDNILTESVITTTLANTSTNEQVPGALTVFNMVSTKQDTITMGSATPNASTPGRIYLQYIE